MNKISIAIPVFNGEKYLKQAIESAIEQTQPADEILVFVHDTKDSSMLIAQEFSDRIKLIEENTNLNIGQAWNRLYELSLCDYIVMLHCDDLLNPNAVKLIRAFIQENPSVGMLFGLSYISNASQPMQESLETFEQKTNFSVEEIPKATNEFQVATSRGFLPGCSGLCLHRKTMLSTKFNEKLSIIIDCEFFARIAYWTEIIGIPNVLATYRIHQSSTLQTTTTKRTLEDYKVWLQELESGSINIPRDSIDQYRGFLLRRLASFYSSLIYDYKVELASEMLSIWKDQISRYNQIYQKSISRMMRIFIAVSLIEDKYFWGISFLFSRFHRFLARYASSP
jgi:glycosyltransferase involved in cell wall biosynthesis